MQEPVEQQGIKKYKLCFCILQYLKQTNHQWQKLYRWRRTSAPPRPAGRVSQASGSAPEQ